MVESLYMCEHFRRPDIHLYVDLFQIFLWLLNLFTDTFQWQFFFFLVHTLQMYVCACVFTCMSCCLPSVHATFSKFFFLVLSLIPLKLFPPPPTLQTTLWRCWSTSTVLDGDWVTVGLLENPEKNRTMGFLDRRHQRQEHGEICSVRQVKGMDIILLLEVSQQDWTGSWPPLVRQPRYRAIIQAMSSSLLPCFQSRCDFCFRQV